MLRLQTPALRCECAADETRNCAVCDSEPSPYSTNVAIAATKLNYVTKVDCQIDKSPHDRESLL